jgi:two-component system LytT family response regulator
MEKIVIIDDEPLARSIVGEYLREYPGLQVMAECNNGYEGVKAILQHKPTLALKCWSCWMLSPR